MFSVEVLGNSFILIYLNFTTNFIINIIKKVKKEEREESEEKEKRWKCICIFIIHFTVIRTVESVYLEK